MAAFRILHDTAESANVSATGVPAQVYRAVQRQACSAVDLSSECRTRRQEWEAWRLAQAPGVPSDVETRWTTCRRPCELHCIRVVHQLLTTLAQSGRQHALFHMHVPLDDDWRFELYVWISALKARRGNDIEVRLNIHSMV